MSVLLMWCCCGQGGLCYGDPDRSWQRGGEATPPPGQGSAVDIHTGILLLTPERIHSQLVLEEFARMNVQSRVSRFCCNGIIPLRLQQQEFPFHSLCTTVPGDTTPAAGCSGTDHQPTGAQPADQNSNRQTFTLSSCFMTVQFKID